MRKIFKTISLFVLILTFVITLVSCGTNSNKVSMDYTNDDTTTTTTDESSDAAKKVTVTFDSNGGKSINPIEIEAGSKLQKPEDPVKESDDEYEYIFMLWWDTNKDAPFNFERDIVNDDLVLKATYETIHIYNITFKYDIENKADEKVKLYYKDKVERPEDPIKASDDQYSYEFAGWYKDLNDNEEYDFNTEITSSFSLYAKWNKTIKSYNVNFVTNGGEAIESKTVNYGTYLDYVTTTKQSTKEYDYNLDYWCIDPELNTKFDFEKTPITGDTTLYAKWNKTIKSYNVNFVTNGGEAIESKTVNYGTYLDYVTTTKQSTKECDYNLDYWCIDPELNTKFDFEKTPITGDITLYAKWNKTIKSYNVNFVTNGGETIESKTVNYGSYLDFVEATKQSTKEYNYSLDYWYIDKELNTKFDFEKTPITGDITLYAKWVEEKRKYILAYNSNGGTSIPNQMVEWGCLIDEPEEQTRSNYIFLGWYNGVTKWDFTIDTMPTDNLTLTALWEELDVKVTYILRNYDGEIKNKETKYFNHADGFSDIEYNLTTGFTRTKWYDKDGNTYYDGKSFNSLELEVYSDIYTYGLGFKLCDGYYAVSNYSGSDIKVYIPYYYYGIPVKVVLKSAFNSNTKIFWVYLPNSIDELEDECFKGCTSINNISVSTNLKKLPKSAFSDSGIVYFDSTYIEEIGEYCFYNCEAFRGFTNNNPYMNGYVSFERISEYAFFECTSLASFNFSGVKFVDEGAFYGCESLTELTNYKSLIIIESYAFYGCDLASFEAGDSLTVIGEFAFKNNYNLTTFTVGNGLLYTGQNIVSNTNITFNVEKNIKYIGSSDNKYYLLYEAPSAKTITVNENCCVIGSSAFLNNTTVQKVVLPEGLEGIGNRAFMGCTNLTSLDISAYGALRVIGDCAFSGIKVTSLTIPTDINYIGCGIISGCDNLTSINCVRPSLWYITISSENDPNDWEPLYLGINSKKWTSYINTEEESDRFLSLLKSKYTRFVFNNFVYSA